MTKTRSCMMIAALMAAASLARAGDDRSAIDAEIADLPSGARVGIDVRRLAAPGVNEASSYERDANAVMPTASAIKTAIMVELFARFAGKLDEPAPGLAAILKDDHPAVAHFRPKQRGEIRAGLSGASVRRIGRVMLGSEDATNLVYNAASNAAIALLGGPEETTRLIHARDPNFAAIMVRRYMLADREAHGDNESTSAALAAVLCRLADRSLPGVSPATIEACRAAVKTTDDPDRGRRRFKGGSLDSLPLTRVATGWYERPDAPPVVYVVMIALDDPAPAPPAEAGARLEQAAERLATLATDSLTAREP